MSPGKLMNLDLGGVVAFRGAPHDAEILQPRYLDRPHLPSTRRSTSGIQHRFRRAVALLLLAR
jgi:hypothetical protein